MVTSPSFYHKKNNSASVAICVPVRDNVTAVFAYSLAMLQRKCGEAGLATSLHFNMGSEVTMQRQQLVSEALETNCTHIMWIDSDMKFPVDTLNILLEANKDIVAGNGANWHYCWVFANQGNNPFETKGDQGNYILTKIFLSYIRNVI